MNASRWQGWFGESAGKVAVLYPACWCRTLVLLALMDSADPHLICRSSSRLESGSRFCGSRSDLFAITPCRALRKLSEVTSCAGSCPPSPTRGYTGWLSKFGWYARSWVNKAQIVRAVLLARATTTTFTGRRSAKRNAHSGGALLLVNTERAPWISTRRVGPSTRRPRRYARCADQLPARCACQSYIRRGGDGQGYRRQVRRSRLCAPGQCRRHLSPAEGSRCDCAPRRCRAGTPTHR